METFKKIATIIGVAIIGYFSFYIIAAVYLLFDIFFSGRYHEGLNILTAIIAVIIYLVKTRKKN